MQRDLRTIKVCPACESPYLVSQVLAEVEVNNLFEWEISYVAPDTLNEIMSYPDTPVHCPRCSWDGTVSNLITVDIAPGQILEETPVETRIPSTLYDTVVVGADNTTQQVEVKVGDVLQNKSDGEKYVVVSIFTKPRAVVKLFDPQQYGYLENTKIGIEFYILNRLGSNNLTGDYHVITGNKLMSMLNEERLTILE